MKMVGGQQRSGNHSARSFELHAVAKTLEPALHLSR
jgi:hypothetical protein